MSIIFWIITFAAGLSLFVFGLVYILTKKSKTEEYLIKTALIEFFACWILYLPEFIINVIPGNLTVLKVFEGIFTALLRSLNIYYGDGYTRLDIIENEVFSNIYSILVVVTNIFMLVMIAGVIIRLLTNLVQGMKLYFVPKQKNYIMFGANEKTFSIAHSLPEEDRKKRNLIFAYVPKEVHDDIKKKIKEVGGIYTDEPDADLMKRLLSKSDKAEVFIFGETEIENLDRLESLSGILKALDIFNADAENINADGTQETQIRIYTEISETPWSLYDDYVRRAGLDNNKVAVNFVRTEENFAYNDLLKNSIFENATDNGDGIKEIKVLIVGMNDRNLEMLKAVLHLSQMPGYRLSVLVIDEAEGRNALRQKMPEIGDGCDRVGDSLYSLRYEEKIPYDSSELDELIEREYADFTFAFVNTGDDLQNINVGMRINAIGYRKKRNGKYILQVNIEDKQVSEKWNNNILEGMDLCGDREGVYSYDALTMSDIERATIAIHEVRYPLAENPDKTWVSYCNNEYNRHSVYARTLSFKYKADIIDKFYGKDYDLTSRDEIWKIYEHMRWNMYTRTLGFVKADAALLDADGKIDKKIRNLAKVHNDLVLFDELSPEEKAKDSLKLEDKIVEILKSI